MIPNAVPRKLTRVEAASMTVNEAVRSRDAEGMRRILMEVYLDKTDIETIIGRPLDKDE